MNEFQEHSDASGARNRMLFLDGIRALCALYVMFSHVIATQMVSVSVLKLISAPSELAVCLFIVISGFSLGISWQRRPTGYVEFMRRRAWRILPPYFAALVISVILIETIIGTETGSHWDEVVPLSWTGTLVSALLLQDFIVRPQPNFVFWSIAIEWHLYFTFPLLIGLLLRKGRLALLAITAVGTAALWAVWGEHRVYLGFAPEMLVLFVFGMLAAHFTTAADPRAQHLRGLITPTRALVLTVLCGGPAVALVKFQPDYLAGAVLLGFAVAALIAALATGPQNHVVRRVLEWRPLVTVGLFSYSLYLIHAPVLQVVWQYGVRPLHTSDNAAFALLAVFGCALSLIVAYVFHLAFERPFLNNRSLKHLLASRNASAQAR